MTDRTCSITDCAKPVQGHGWCSKHYARWYRHGDPLTSGRITPGSAPAELDRLLNLPPTDDHILWPFGKINGYGTLHASGKASHLTHRIACEHHHGPPPFEGAVVARHHSKAQSWPATIRRRSRGPLLP